MVCPLMVRLPARKDPAQSLRGRQWSSSSSWEQEEPEVPAARCLQLLEGKRNPPPCGDEKFQEPRAPHLYCLPERRLEICRHQMVPDLLEEEERSWRHSGKLPASFRTRSW